MTKLTRTLLQVGAAANALFFFFHLWLGWQIQHLPGIVPGLRSLLHILNGGGALFLVFLALASWVVAREPRPTTLGRLVVWLGAALYVLRSLAEFVVPPQFNPAIFATCLATGLVFAAVLFFQRRQPEAAAQIAIQTTSP